MKHFIRVFLLLMVSAILLCGCDEPSDSEGSGVLPNESADVSASTEKPPVLPKNLSLPYYPEQSLDPVSCPDGVQQTVSALLCEGLFELDGTLVPQPRLCSSYTYDPATLTYVFSLRPGTLFSDGSALSSKDVVDTLKRAQTSARYGTRLGGMTSITAGDGSVIVTLSSPNAMLPALLDIPIVKAGTADSIPIGTGPYQFSATENGAKLTANTNWKDGKQPVEQILLKSSDNPDTTLYQFASHETQLLTSDLTGSNPVSVTGNIHFYDADSTIFQYVGIHVSNPILSNSALRQALSLGFDRGQTVSAFLSGHGKPTQFPISPVTALYPATLEKHYSYDAFQQAMTALGYASGKTISLTMIVNEESSFKVAAARYIASSLSAFDLKIQVSALPWDEYTAALASGKFDLYYGEVKLTADWDLRPLLATGGALNYGGFSDPALDALLSTSISTENDRTPALHNVCRRIASTAPILPICFKTESVLVQQDVVENLTPTAANPFYDLVSCTVHLKQED